LPKSLENEVVFCAENQKWYHSINLAGKMVWLYAEHSILWEDEYFSTRTMLVKQKCVSRAIVHTTG
jgi:hypothetical protein